MVHFTTAPTGGPTIGMHIDAVIAKFQSLPSTHLYALVIAVSISFSFFLLNSGGSAISASLPPKMPTPNDHEDEDELRKPKAPKIQSKSHAMSSLSSLPDEPQPKWHILKLTNYLATTGFLLSVLQFAFNASTYLNDSTSLLQFLTLWSIFLCYFFGFFGISFVELDDFVDAQPQEVQGQVQPPLEVSKGKPRKSLKVDR